MSIGNAIESAVRDHKALYAVDPLNRPELEKVYDLLKTSLDALNRTVAERAFQDGRSKRKQWGEIQKQVADLLEEGGRLVERDPTTHRDLSGKIDERYSRIHTRITRLAEG